MAWSVTLRVTIDKVIKEGFSEEVIFFPRERGGEGREKDKE